MAAEKESAAKVDLGLLEEDDEFEEFPADDAESKGVEDTTVNVWEDNWDDDAKEDDFANQLSAMEGSVNKRLREREETPPPAKKRCTQATPPAPKNNGSSNGHDATHTELESLGRNGSTKRGSRTSATSSTSSPPASPARRGRRGAAGGSSSGSDQQPQTPTRTSGRLRKN